VIRGDLQQSAAWCCISGDNHLPQMVYWRKVKIKNSYRFPILRLLLNMCNKRIISVQHLTKLLVQANSLIKIRHNFIHISNVSQ